MPVNRVQIVYRKTSDLKPYANNPRKNDAAVDFVANSIRQFGFKNPIIIDAKDEIICGHTRLRAAIQLDLAEIPCICADDLSDEQVRMFRLADNKVSERAMWDEQLLNSELGCLVDMDMSQFGFIRDAEAAKDDDFDPTPPAEPVTKLGDLWLLGRHRLLCADSTDARNVQYLMDGGLADMLLTDPPYGIDYTGKTKDALKIQNDHMSDSDFREFLVRAFTAADQSLKPGAAIYIWHADTEGYNFRGACADAGWPIKECLVWCKSVFTLGRQDYQWKHEPCLYLQKPGAPCLWAADRTQTTVLNFDKPSRSKDHPTTKPVPLFDALIKNNTRPMDVVLDTFGGSGTSVIACEQNGRTCRTMELDPRYADVIVNRYVKSATDTENIYLVRNGTRLSFADVFVGLPAGM